MKKYKLVPKSKSDVRIEAKSADGIEGFLLRGIAGMFFRVYDEDHNFKDYDLWHHDLEVKIKDPGAYFYRRPNGTLCLDYSPEALGYEESD